MIENLFTARNSNILYGIFYLINFLIAYNYYPSLPEKIATHFGSSNSPSSYSDKLSFLLLYNIIMLFLTAMFWGINYLMKIGGDSMVNLPNKKYWLAPERREATIEKLRANMNFFGLLTFLFMLLNQIYIFEANLLTEVRLGDSFWITFVVYMMMIMIWLMRMLRIFSKDISEEISPE
jgi:uncharacterized membrane protein